MDEEDHAINFIREQELGNALRKLRTTQCSIYNVSNIAVILIRRLLYNKELVSHITVPLQLPQQAVPCSTSSVAFRPVSNALAKGLTLPPHCNGGACRQLPLSTGDYTASVALPLSRSAARISHEWRNPSRD